jgi:A/G-specific adenine glycosylase
MVADSWSGDLGRRSRIRGARRAGGPPTVHGVPGGPSSGRGGPRPDGPRPDGPLPDGPSPERPLRRGLGEVVGEWAAHSRRELPWRSTRDPWAVLVSETMLQQTQVARVVGPWTRFLARFPDPPACAAAAPGEVIGLWAGLGYNRRALQLHAAATRICERHGGRVPDELADLVALPGVGPYTARAVLAFAFERDVGVVDTNAARVLARAAAGRTLGRAEAQRLADALVPVGRGWAHNQAMLDLGSQYCQARRPVCGACPVGAVCAWALAGHPLPDPAIGSAGTSARQSTFSGSDRQGRGRLVAALRRGPVASGDVAATMGWPDDVVRAERVVRTLATDGLIRWRDDGSIVLPGM